MSKVSLHDVYEIVGRVESKLDKMEIRLSSLEIWRANLMGKIAIVGSMVMIAANVSADYIKQKLFSK